MHPDTRKLIDQTVSAWRRWASGLDWQGSQAELMKRSALTLKLLDHAETGAIMAAATSSLPEWPGAPRNWDYRYTWVRDASFSNYVFRRIGDPSDADVFLVWVLTNVERDGAPHVTYALDGSQPPDEVQDPLLRGYRGSAPVRWGNGAIHQLQHDVYGEIIDIAYQWSNSGGRVDGRLWAALRPIVELAIQRWKTPDAALLTLPVRNVIAFDDPRMVSTTKAIAEGLDAGNDCCSATDQKFPRTGCLEVRAPSCSAASGSWITLPGRAGSTRPTRYTRSSAAGRIRCAC